MKKILFGLIVFLIPFISGLRPESLATRGELTQASMGNNVFFGTIVALILIVLIAYIFNELRKKKKR